MLFQIFALILLSSYTNGGERYVCQNSLSIFLEKSLYEKDYYIL